MGYDLHVVRTRGWLDALREPITAADVDALIARDAEYAWSTSEWFDSREGETGQVRRHYGLEWRGETIAWLDRGELTLKSPDEAQVFQLIRLAEALGAMVVGDDDELYRMEMDEDGQPVLAWEQWDGQTGAYEPTDEEVRAEREEARGAGPWLWKMYLRLDRVIYRVMNGVYREDV